MSVALTVIALVALWLAFLAVGAGCARFIGKRSH